METAVQNRKYKVLLQAVLFGFMFGFLLQKGGVAKYHVLEGQLLLADFTVMKIMLSAILVAMTGLFFLRKTAKIKFHIKPTKVASNIIGGLIFGVGFACAGYCPGTGAAGLGQGDLPAIIFMVGLIVGSYLFAESSGFLKRTLDTWGNKGKITLHTALRINAGPSVALFAVGIIGALILIKNINL
jgi:uncharacterized membrane protein YedE/YeeE